MFRQDYLLRRLSVRGEVSNCKYYSSGHIYFTLKDSRGAISCVMFSGSREGLLFRLADGQQVIVSGDVDVYERDGKYQLRAREIFLDGSGQLHEALERLKRELREAGMFAQEYKKPIPRFIRTLGVVTSDAGKAVRDIMEVAGKRNPYVQIILYPAAVQGEAAPASIVRGIRALERLGVDVMIVGRGGGSTEDLWTFNAREVAQAAFDCSVPIISAVGHKTDVTILDFVADLWVATPSVAAQKAVTDIREILGELSLYQGNLQRLMRRRIERSREEARQMELRLRLASPESRIRERKLAVLSAEERLRERMRRLLEMRRHKLAIYIERMKGLSPLEKLSSGYSYVEDAAGRNVRSVRQVREGQELVIRMKDGQVRARATRILPPAGGKTQTC